MAAMLDKTATAPAMGHPHPLFSHHVRHHSRSQTYDSANNSRRPRAFRFVRPIEHGGERDFWQNEFENRLHGLGITNGPYKFEIRRGKTVPRPDSRQPSPPADPDDKAALPPVAPVRPPPPRNPRRPHREPSRNPASISLDQLPAATSRFKTRVRDMYGRPTGAIEISPPSSPEFNASRHGAHDGDVSPIEETFDASKQQFIGSHGVRHPGPPPPRPAQQYQLSKSHIPTMRREKRRNPEPVVSTLKQSQSKDNLRDQQNLSVKHPWEQPPRTPDEQQNFGLTTIVTGPQVHRTGNPPPPSFGQRMRQFGRSKPEALDERPPWNGASGRTATVDPVRDDLSVAPLSIPAKSNRRVSRMSPVGPAGSETSSGAAAAVRRLLPSRSNQKLRDAAKSSSQPDLHAQPYPSPPYAESPITVSHASPPPPTQTTGSSGAPPFLSPNLATTDKAIKRKPPPSQAQLNSHNPHISTSSSVYSTQPDNSQPYSKPQIVTTGAFSSPSTPADPWVQPPSRFSITTCNTTIPGTPRDRDSLEEDRPPMPTPPTQLTSVMDRRRPVPGGSSVRSASAEPIVITMNTSYTPDFEGRDKAKESKDRPISILSTSKALPPAPPEIQSANDRVANLNARLESLAHRRININKSIKQMTELMPTDNILASADVLRKREVEKKKVEGLREELAEIQREEHDLGLKLYRANKRLDRDGEFEPTTLWVRRVTH